MSKNFTYTDVKILLTDGKSGNSTNLEVKDYLLVKKWKFNLLISDKSVHL